MKDTAQEESRVCSFVFGKGKVLELDAGRLDQLKNIEGVLLKNPLLKLHQSI